MTDRDLRLQQFFGAYFHEDWGDDAKSWRHVVAGYVREHTRVQVLALQDDMRSWLEETAAFPAAVLPFGCSYNPLWDEGLREREWVALLVDLLGKMLTN